MAHAAGPEAPAPAAGAARRTGLRRPDRAGWTEALVATCICTLLSELLLPFLALGGSATIYLAGVVWVALRQGQAASMLAVVLSILMFDLLVVAPRWSLTPIDPQQYLTFAVMAVVGWFVGRLAERARQQARIAEARAHRAQALNELSARLLAARSPQEVADGLASAVRSTFDATAQLHWPEKAGASGQAACAGSADGRVPVIPSSTTVEDADSRGATAAGERAEAPAGALLRLPLPGMDGQGPVLALRWPQGHAATLEERQLLDAFVNQAALAMQRAWFEQRSVAAAVDAQAERLRNTLLSGISHDFRTPLTTIIGSAASLLEQDPVLAAPARTALLRSIVDEAQRLHGSMSDLLDLTRMEEGGVRPRCEWCPADELVQEARQALGARLGSRTLRIEVPAEAVVWCDPRLLQQALVNLLDNAARHTPAASAVEVRVETDADAWRLLVGDDGPGLPPALAGDPFKKFAHGRRESTASAGTGLGLALCAAVARLHGGRIEAGPGTQGRGVRFTLTLPLPPGSTPPTAEEAP